MLKPPSRVAGQHDGTPGRTGAARRAAFIVLTAACGLLVSAAPVLAAGTGYGGTGGTGTGTTGTPSAPPGFTTVLTAQTVEPSGGTVSAGGVTVTVPAGAFTSPTQVELTQGTLTSLTGLPAGADPVIAVGISFLQNGQKVTGSFGQPVSVSISNPVITSADQVIVWNSTTGTYTPASQDPDISGLSVTNGVITFQVTADPYLVALGTQSSTAVPSATVPTTGFPVVGEAVVGLAFVAGGLLLARSLRSRRRRIL